ncbi:MAG: hypothetical protein E6468_09025 [Varibaculum cambriense]|uniref:hypothetical protein n=1 Tax=Varibaculum cambriense TaxID=184870 RepID=UPI00290CED83|nr:hypothetical protein [Varibaculum cambriense]MDU6681966.1 hypothetical protein [Varibaculum cambriense]
MSKIEEDKCFDLLRDGRSALIELAQALSDESKHFESQARDLGEDINEVQETGEDWLDVRLSMPLTFLNVSADKILSTAKRIKKISKAMEETHSEMKGLCYEQ